MDPSGELRQNVVTGRWIAIAPGRGARPFDPDGGAGGAAEGLPERDPSCPFCPGNESRLPAVLAETKGDGGPWATRVVPNKYPAFTNDPGRGEWVEAQLADAHAGIGKSLALGSDVPVVLADPLPAVGYQEVIIDTPRHDLELVDLTSSELETVLATYRERYLSVSDSVPTCRVFLFRNRGERAGTSLVHAHAQLIATAVVPPEVRVREIRMLGYHGDHGRCLVCSLPDVEPDWDARVVASNDRFVATVPWAAETPFEVWLVPRTHQAEFGETDDEDRAALADVLSRVLRALRDRAGDPAYNLMVHSPRRSRSGSAAVHWYIQIRPRRNRPAGFELGSGIMINPSSPVRDAAILRGDGEGASTGPA